MSNLSDSDIEGVEVQATVFDIGKIRLKFFGLPGDVGPDLVMDETMARSIIAELSKCLPEYELKGS